MRFINYNWYIALGFCLVFFISGRQLAEVPGGSKIPGARDTRGKKLTCVLLLIFALPPLFLFNICPSITTISSAPWYNSFRAFNRIETFTAMIAPFSGYATYLPQEAAGYYSQYEAPISSSIIRVIKPLAFPLCAVLISLCFLRPVVLPLPANVNFVDNWSEDGVLLATIPATSGAAALASAMYSVNHAADSEKSVAGGIYTDNGGADFWYIARHAVNRGFRCRFYELNEEAIMNGVIIPSIVRTSTSDRTAYVAVVARSDSGTMKVADPYDGILELSPDMFLSLYGSSTLALALDSKS